MWEKVVHLDIRACLSRTFTSLCVLLSLLVLMDGVWDLNVSVPDLSF